MIEKNNYIGGCVYSYFVQERNTYVDMGCLELFYWYKCTFNLIHELNLHK